MQQFDRAAEDLGNAIHLEHVNVQVPDQRLAQLFYASGLGLTRDPYLMVADTNMPLLAVTRSSRQSIVSRAMPPKVGFGAQ